MSLLWNRDYTSLLHNSVSLLPSLKEKGSKRSAKCHFNSVCISFSFWISKVKENDYLFYFFRPLWIKSTTAGKRLFFSPKASNSFFLFLTGFESILMLLHLPLSVMPINCLHAVTFEFLPTIKFFQFLICLNFFSIGWASAALYEWQ